MADTVSSDDPGGPTTLGRGALLKAIAGVIDLREGEVDSTTAVRLSQAIKRFGSQLFGLAAASPNGHDTAQLAIQMLVMSGLGQTHREAFIDCVMCDVARASKGTAPHLTRQRVTEHVSYYCPAPEIWLNSDDRSSPWAVRASWSQVRQLVRLELPENAQNAWPSDMSWLDPLMQLHEQKAPAFAKAYGNGATVPEAPLPPSHSATRYPRVIGCVALVSDAALDVFLEEECAHDARFRSVLITLGQIPTELSCPDGGVAMLDFLFIALRGGLTDKRTGTAEESKAPPRPELLSALEACKIRSPRATVAAGNAVATAVSAVKKQLRSIPLGIAELNGTDLAQSLHDASFNLRSYRRGLLFRPKVDHS